MKPIKIKNISIELDKLQASEGYKSLVLNNVMHYNSIIKEIALTSNLKREYLAYVLSVQICKLLLDLKKFQKRTNTEPEPEDSFTKLVNSIKKPK